MKEIFTPEFLKEIGFTPVTKYESESFDGKITKYEVEPPYGRAIDKRSNGMTVLTWNTEGPDIDYFGEPIEEGSVYFGVGKDGGTRTAFNGYVFNQDDVRRVLKLTW
jgi:hypothetical protein